MKLACFSFYLAGIGIWMGDDGSLITIIITPFQGMSFLHCNIGPHGRLSSSKCLVDARFVVKIADFSLHGLRSLQQKEAMDVDYFISK